MPPSSHSHDLTRAVHETLDSVVSPAVRDNLIGQALNSAEVQEIPADPTRFRQFLDGPLQSALMRALGTELGRSVARELDRVTEPIVRKRLATPAPVRRVLLRPRSNPPTARSGSSRPRSNPPARRQTPIDVPRPSGRSRDSTNTPTRPPASPQRDQALPAVASVPTDPPTASSSARRPVVLVATRDVDAMGRFGALLDPRAAVVRVSRLIDLLLDLRGAAEKRRVVIVLDCRHAPFRPHALAAVAEELAEDARVVLWGADRELGAELRALSPQSECWIFCPPGMSDADVAARCAEIVR